MQCKDIPDAPILAFLAANDWAAGWHDFEGPEYCPTVRDCMPAGVPPKLRLAKMRGLINRGLVTGCACGCRGDFEITDKGRASL